MTAEKRQKVGLLGGSFNPPHDGHRYISQEAIKCLGLDAVWWVVSPHNPFKSKSELASAEERVQLCQSFVASSNNIEVSDAEVKLGTSYTYDLLVHMCKQFPDVDFIWLMGEDNWLCFDQWYRWQDIMQLVPVAIFHREIEASWESCSASEVFAGARVVDFSQLVNCKTPAWSYLPIEAHAMSSTKIRKG